MRPIEDKFPDSQAFGSYATAGVAANPNGNEVQQLVAAYGNYQPYGHAGKDIACPVGTPVRAMAAGTVIWAGWGEDLPGDDSWGPSGYFQRWAEYKSFPGILTLIQHDGWISEYGHLSSNDAAPVGATVTEGQIIGYSGNTKTRTTQVAPHLHVGALVDLTYSTGNGLIYGRVDPTPYFGGLHLSAESITPQEDDLSAAAEAQIARITQILEAQESDNIRQRIVAIDDRTATSGTKYLKGDQDATLYEFDGGKLRGINLTEWQATGQGYRTLPQDIINALPKEG